MHQSFADLKNIVKKRTFHLLGSHDMISAAALITGLIMTNVQQYLGSNP